ncbi:MAG TPA: enoyl-CoA hydratase-related protein [Candidatus Hydrogenedentes bacterium]|nr:enoyl-CoA hydratase-related protein [Candidatus Hydrogenedentota bacterium]
MSAYIDVRRERGAWVFAFNRIDRKNALTVEMYETLAGLLEDAASNGAVRCVVFTGHGGMFTSGNDIQDFVSRPPQSDDHPVLRFLRGLATFPKPMIAAVEGVAVGVGVTMLLHCDLVFISREAKLRLPFVNLALCPEAGSSVLLPERVGATRAAELLLLGETFSGEEAVAWGIANRLCEPGRTLVDAMAAATRIVDQPPAAVRATLALLRGWRQQEVLDAIAREAEVFRERLSSPEAVEAFQAFLEKRPPDYSRFA